MQRSLVVLALCALAAACGTARYSTVSDLDPARRAELLDRVAGLEGTWVMEEGDGEIQFHVMAAGSAVREIMFPGSEHEMTNVYHLDGNELVVTHYCAAGNQPRMVASKVDGNRITFHTDSVSDLKPGGGPFMGELTLVLVDAGHIEQHWRSITLDGAVAEENVFSLARR